MFISSTTGVGDALHIQISNANKVRITNETTQFLLATNAISLSTWTHIAVVRSGSTLSIYQNGTLNGTTTNSTNFTQNGAVLGYEMVGGNFYYTGYMSNVRVVKGVAVYTGAFTVPTSPLTATQSSGTNIAAITGTSTSVLTCQSSTFIDNSTNNFTITASGNSQPTQQNPFGFTSALTNGYTVSTIGGSGYFDGTGDYLDAGGQTAFAFGTGDLTFECWIYATVANDSPIYESRSTVSNTNGFTVTALSSTVIRVYTSGVLVSATVSNYLNVWTHIAFTRQGSTNRLFINGVLGSTNTSLDNFSYASAIIGGGRYLNNNISAYFTGYITDVRLVKGTALYTSNFVPPAAPLTAVQNTSLLTNMTSAGIYDASMITTMESGGDAKLSTAVSKFGGSSMYFDGTGDYIVASGTTATGTSAFGSGDFTIEFWLYANSVAATDQGLIDMRPTSTNGYYPYLYMYNGQVGYWLNATSVITSSAGAITTGTWYHIALARSGSSNKLFINGVQSGSTFTSSTALLCDSNRPAIGTAGTSLGASSLNGYIDDLRITKGYARYTSNFTLPTSAFQIK